MWNSACENSIQTYSSIKVIWGGGGGHNHLKGTSVWILCCCGRKLDNESQWLAITAAVVTCQDLPSMSRREASCCYGSGTPSPGAVLRCVERLLIPLEPDSLLKSASQTSGLRILEMSVQTTWKFNQLWLPLHSEYNMYYLFMHTPPQPYCWPLNY